MSVLSSMNFQLPPNYMFWKRKASRSEEKTTFSDCVYQFYLTSRVYGLMPFALVYKNGEIRAARVGLFDLLWFIVSLTIYGNLIYFAPSNTPWRSHMPPGLVFEHHLQIIIGLIRTMFAIIVDMHNRHTFVRIIVDLINFDKKVISWMKF